MRKLSLIIIFFLFLCTRVYAGQPTDWFPNPQTGKADYYFDPEKLPDVDIEDDTPHLTHRDTDDNVAYQWHLDTSTANAPYQNFGLYRGTDDGTTFSVGNFGFPLIYFNNANQIVIPYNKLKIQSTIEIPSGTTLPATCAVGDCFWDTDADIDGSLYVCRATDTWKEVDDDGGAGGGAPTDADYLVGTANATLTAEIVVGTTPGGSLGGTWASPTIDDLFIKNDASDTMVGTFTSDGLTLGTNENLTFGTETFTFDAVTSNDFELSDDLNIKDTDPHLKLVPATGDAFETYAYGNEWYFTNVTDSIVLWRVKADNNIYLERNTTINQDLIHEFSRSAVVENLAAADDNMSLGSWTNNVTINKVGCAYVGTGTTPATITLEDGSGNAMTHNTCTCVASGTDITFVSVTANNTLNAGELLRFDTTNAVSPESDEYTITIGYTE